MNIGSKEMLRLARLIDILTEANSKMSDRDRDGIEMAINFNGCGSSRHDSVRIEDDEYSRSLIKFNEEKIAQYRAELRDLLD